MFHLGVSDNFIPQKSTSYTVLIQKGGRGADQLHILAGLCTPALAYLMANMQWQQYPMSHGEYWHETCMCPPGNKAAGMNCKLLFTRQHANHGNMFSKFWWTPCYDTKNLTILCYNTVFSFFNKPSIIFLIHHRMILLVRKIAELCISMLEKSLVSFSGRSFLCNCYI